MQHEAGNHLEILAQLAREYEQKYKELEAALKDLDAESAIHQLKVRAELSTGRFRAAQQVLLASLSKTGEKNEGVEEPLRAATALCRGFDEIRILFQMLLDYSSGPK